MIIVYGDAPLLGSVRTPKKVLVSYLYKRKVSERELYGFDLALNFHPAPLPEYRGFAPYTFGILNGETEWGVSCHHMTAEIDAGPLVEVRRFKIEDPENVTAAGLKDQTMPHLKRLYQDVLERVARGEELPRLENEGGVYYSKEMFEEARLTYNETGIPRGDPYDIVDATARAFWCPPHPGLEWRGFTIAPKCVAGGK